MPRGEGVRDLRQVAHVPLEREESLTEVCRQAVERLAARLPGAQVSCHLLVGDSLRVLASEGGLRLIYEVRRGQGGIGWRAVETGEAQLVEDVRRDPDYMATDEKVLAEVAVPVAGEGEATLVLDAEFTDRSFTQEEAEAVLAEAAQLERTLAGQA
jgi:putative methionine-R-sulfoxide reductase with GAF domain